MKETSKNGLSKFSGHSGSTRGRQRLVIGSSIQVVALLIQVENNVTRTYRGKWVNR
jgi:hypothetical protein